MKKIIIVVFCALLISSVLASTSPAMDFSVHGYFRNRGVVNYDLDLHRKKTNMPDSNDRFGLIQYNQMRLRLEPVFKLNNYLSMQGQLDILDNVLFGSKDTEQLHIIAPIVGDQTLPPGAGSFYMSGPSTVGTNGAINVRRIWADILTPIGKFRIGRQPSNWGLGIFQNDGNDLQGDFGDTADRLMYIMQYDIAGTGAMTGGLFWDIAYDAQFDPRQDLFNTTLAPNSDDCQQYGAILLFERPEFALGMTGGLRRRNGRTGNTTMWVTDANGDEIRAGIDGKTLMYFADLYARYTYENYEFKFEGVYLGGKVTTGLALDSIPFAGLSGGVDGIIQLPPEQRMRTFMAAFEATGKYKTGDEWKFQTGYAEGDDTPFSNNITMFGFRPDYQIALIMFNLPLGSSPALYGAKNYGPAGSQYLAGKKPITSNYINNALYFSLGYKHKFDLAGTEWAQWAKVGTKITTAWAPKKNTNINLADLIPQQGRWPSISERSTSMWQRWYGLEVDLLAEAMLFENLYTALEGGILLPGRAYDIDVNLVDPGSIIDPIPRDKAELAWMIRLTASILF
ncbi:MAG TPA: hypothetical protein PKU96_05845 [bacterium]|nr:hypothetical protein [Myxococcales bacterium]OQA60900.1 MAG: hypothetical protein BWY40_00834 [bacterium ADurb.Bin270]HPW45873.1 hypothetical protein [bacterium]HQC50347.1 hypothetical protein [bacterium]HQG12999.1 hypothetical protein [bacterium]